MSKSVHVPQDVKDRVTAKLTESLELVQEAFDRQFDFPNVIYKKRGRVAGTACSDTYTIDLNGVLLMENLDDFIFRTVPHELAHLIDCIMYPETRDAGVVWTRRGMRRGKRSVHGPTWKRIMNILGAPISRCHKYDTTNSSVKKRSSKKHVWVCGCGNGKVTLTNRKHQRQLRVAPTGFGVYQRGHTVRRCGNYTYQGLSSDWTESAPTSALPKVANPAYPEWASKDLGTVTPRQANKAGLSKVDLCLAMYKINFPMPRPKLIQMFMDELGMTKACASTYYANTKKKIRNGA